MCVQNVAQEPYLFQLKDFSVNQYSPFNILQVMLGKIYIDRRLRKTCQHCCTIPLFVCLLQQNGR